MGEIRRYGDPLAALDDPVVPPPTVGKIRHVWLNLSNLKQAPSRYAGVILDWRRSATGWEAQVAYVTHGSDRADLHVIWCTAERLTPVASGSQAP